jgi:hypothetical protein
MRFCKRRCLLAASAFFCLSSTSLANDLTPPIAPSAVQSSLASAGQSASEVCGLHVWPAGNAQTSYRGWFHGGAVDGDKRGIKGYPALHGEVLTTAVQHQLLANIDWSNRLATPNLAVVVHDQPPPAQDDLDRTAPLIADRPDCYDELIVHSVFVERAVFSATSVRLVIIGKKWSGQNTEPSTFSLMTDQKVRLDDQHPDNLESSLKDGFVASLGKALNTKYLQRH